MLFYFFSKYVLFLFLKIYHRAERIGLENVPRKGPFIIIANHASYLDPWYLGILFPPRHIRYIVTTKWYFRSKLWKLFFDLYGCILVTPGKMELSSIKRIMNVLKRGGVIGIFPEGRISNNGKMQEFDSGAIYLAQRADVPIIPVAICGSYDALPRHSRMPKPKKIRIVIGKPVYIPKSHSNKKSSKEKYRKDVKNIGHWLEKNLNQFKRIQIQPLQESSQKL